jgi:hypothetical protein
MLVPKPLATLGSEIRKIRAASPERNLPSIAPASRSQSIFSPLGLEGFAMV